MSNYPKHLKRTTITPWWAHLFLWMKPWMMTRSDVIFGSNMEVRSKKLFGVTYILSIKKYR